MEQQQRTAYINGPLKHLSVWLYFDLFLFLWQIFPLTLIIDIWQSSGVNNVKIWRSHGNWVLYYNINKYVISGLLSLYMWCINIQTDMQQPKSIHVRQDAQRAITLTKFGLLKTVHTVKIASSAFWLTVHAHRL